MRDKYSSFLCPNCPRYLVYTSWRIELFRNENCPFLTGIHGAPISHRNPWSSRGVHFRRDHLGFDFFVTFLYPLEDAIHRQFGPGYHWIFQMKPRGRSCVSWENWAVRMTKGLTCWNLWLSSVLKWSPDRTAASLLLSPDLILGQKHLTTKTQLWAKPT